jgi:thioesterase domain-containing protein
MAAYVRRSGGQRLAEPVLTRVRDGEPGRELFYVHPAGGTTFCYYELARHSTEPSPVWALSFPFSEAGTLRGIPEVAARYVEEIRAVKPHGPYRLGGYSFGGNVAFEMALQLQAAGERVEEIVMFDSHPPEAYAGQLVTEEEFLRSFPLLLEVAFGDSSALGTAPPRSVREVVEMARQPSWTSYTEDEYEKFVRAWIVNHEALKLYEPWATFDGDVTVFAARQPEDPRLLEMLKIRSLPKDTWQRHVDGRVTVVPAPGNHYTMFSDEECLVELAATYDRVLAGPGGVPA